MADQQFPAYEPPNHNPPEPAAATPAAAEAFRCPNCSGSRYHRGFIEGYGQSAVRWYEGPLEVGLFGGTSTFGRERRHVLAYRCTGCSRLELYAGDEA